MFALQAKSQIQQHPHIHCNVYFQNTIKQISTSRKSIFIHGFMVKLLLVEAEAFATVSRLWGPFPVHETKGV
jgi:hypothetical protein